MTVKNLSTTMRIEIPPGLRDKSKDNGPQPPSASRRRRSQRSYTPNLSERQSFGSSRHTIVSDANFQQLFQSVYDAALITNLKGDILDANARAEEFFNAKRLDFCNHSILALISGADHTLLETLRKNLENDRFTLIQAFCQKLDGALFPSEISVNRLQLTGNDYFCFFVRDITMRRKREETVRTVHNAIHNAGNGIAITDTEGGIEYVNPAAINLWGHSDEKALLNNRIQDLLEESSDVAVMMRSISASGATWVGKLKARRHDGRSVPLQVSATVNHDTEDHVVGMVFSFLDVSDSIRADKMARQTERQKIILESIGSACHYLGQPATVLLASLEMMKKRESLIDQEMRSLLSQGIDSARKLQTVLHRLNNINEYRTVPYLDPNPDETQSAGEHILQF